MVIYTKALKSMMPKKLSMALLLAAGSISSLFADNRISVQDFTIVDGKTAVVSVKMENDPNVTSLGATIQLPAGMSIVQEYDQYTDDNVNFILNSSRTYDPEKLYDEQTLQRHFLMDSEVTTNKYIIAIGHDEELPFIGNSGEEIFHFTVQADGALADNTQLEFTNVHFDIKEGNTRDEVLQDDFSVNVTKVASLPPVGIITTDVQEISITPGRNHYKIVTVSMNNDSDISGVSMKIVLPTGLKFVTGVEGFPGGVSYNERSKKLQPKLNRETGVLTMSTMNKTDKILAGEGEIFAFLVEADTSLPAESNIDINTIRLTTMYKRPGAAVETAYTIVPDDVNIKVLNPDAAAKPAADKAIADAQAALDALKEEYADVIANGNMPAAVQAAQDAVDALKKKIDDAWEAGELAETDYSAEVAAAEKTLADAKYIGDEERAKVAADKVLADLQKLYDEAVAKVAADYPEVKDAKAVTDVEKAAQDLIDAYKNKVDEAYGLKNLQTATTTEWENLAKAGIEKIVPEAAAAQAAKEEAEAQAENQTILTDAQKKKEAAEAAAADVPSVWGDKVKQERDDLNAAMDALRKAVNDAAAAGTAHTQEVKDDVAAKAQAVEDAAAALQVKAETVKADYADETAQQAYNTDLYNKVHADAKKAIEDVPTEIENKMGNFISAVNEADAALKQAIDDAAFNNNANTDDVKANIAALEKAERDAIDAMKAASQQFYKEYKDEIAQQEANDKILNDAVDAQTDAKRIKNNADILNRDEAAVKVAERTLDDAVDTLRDLVTAAKQNNTANTTASKIAITAAKEAVDAAAAALKLAATNAQKNYDAEMAAQEANDQMFATMDNAAEKAIEEVPTEVKNDVEAWIKAVREAKTDLEKTINEVKANEAASQTDGAAQVEAKKKQLENAIQQLKNAAETALAAYQAEQAEQAKNAQTVLDKQAEAKAAQDAVPTEVQNEVAAEQQALTDAVKALQDAVKAAADANNANTDDVKADIAEKAQAVTDAAAALTEAAAAAKEAYDAEVAEEAKNAQTLLDKQNEAKAAEDQVNPLVKEDVAAEQQALTDAVKALQDAVKAAADNKNANTDEVKADIAEKAQAVTDAANALTEAAEKAKEAYDAEQLEQAKNAQTVLDAEAAQTEATNAVPAEVKADVAAEQKALDDAVKALQDAVKAAADANNANTDDVKADIAAKKQAVDDAVAALKEAAEKAKEAYDAEVAEQAKNAQTVTDAEAAQTEATNAVPAEVKADVAAEQKALDDAVKALQDAVNAAAEAGNASDDAVKADIAAKKQAVDDAAAALKEAAEKAKEAYDAEVAEEAANAQTVTDAEAAQTAATNAAVAAEVADRVTAEQKALDDAVKALQDAVNAAAAAGNANTDDVKADVAAKKQAVDDAVAALNDAVTAAKAAKEAEEAAAAAEAAEQAANAQTVTAAEAAQTEATNAAVAAEVADRVADEQKALDDAVKALKDAVDAAAAAGNANTDDVKADIAAKKQAVDDAVAALNDAVKAAADQKKQDDIMADLSNDLNAINTYYSETDKAIQSGDTDVYPAFKDQLDAVAAAIDELVADLADKYAKGELTDESNYDEEIAALQAQLDEIQAAADKAQQEFTDKKNENQRAKDRLENQLDELQKLYDEVKDQLKNDDVWDDFLEEMKKLQNDIDALGDAVAEKYDNMELTDETSIDNAVNEIAAKLDDLKNRADILVGITTVRAGVTVPGAQYYTLGGKLIAAPVKGQMVIVKYADGTTKKAFVK